MTTGAPMSSIFLKTSSSSPCYLSPPHFAFTTIKIKKAFSDLGFPLSEERFLKVCRHQSGLFQASLPIKKFSGSTFFYQTIIWKLLPHLGHLNNAICIMHQARSFLTEAAALPSLLPSLFMIKSCWMKFAILKFPFILKLHFILLQRFHLSAWECSAFHRWISFRFWQVLHSKIVCFYLAFRVRVPQFGDSYSFIHTIQAIPCHYSHYSLGFLPPSALFALCLLAFSTPHSQWKDSLTSQYHFNLVLLLNKLNSLMLFILSILQHVV